MTSVSSSARAEAEVRSLIEKRTQATRDKNVPGATSTIAPDLVMFDVVDPLRRAGSNEATQRSEAWFSTFKNQIGFVIRDLVVVASEDVAFSHSLNHYRGETSNGLLSMWVRMTTCYQRVNGNWMIVHEHSSVPFNTDTGKASTNLQP